MAKKYFVWEDNIGGFFVKARKTTNEDIYSPLQPNEYILTEEKIKEQYGNEAAELLDQLFDYDEVVIVE